MSLFINTCLFPVGEIQLLNDYYEKFQNDLCFELLAKFDDDNFEKDLDYLLSNCPKTRFAFHEPVFLAEHTAKPGSESYNKTMSMIEQTNIYAKQFKAEHLVYHINNCRYDINNKEELLKVSLENFNKITKIFNYLDVYVENVGIVAQESMLLNQDEFCSLCKKNNFKVLIDIGHANANNWDLYKLTTDLKNNIKAFHIHNNDGVNDLHNRINNGTFNVKKFLQFSKQHVPDAKWILEYIHPKYLGNPLAEDIKDLLEIQK